MIIEGPQVPLQAAERRTITRVIAEEAYKEYVAQFGSLQTFDRLHERGGFGPIELASLLYQRIKKLESQQK